MTSPIDFEYVVPTERMRGEDEEDTALLQVSLREARTYLTNFAWCHGVRKEFFGLGVGGVVAVFLFEIMADEGNDDVLWVVSGDLPCAYVVTDNAVRPSAALHVYCELMDDWIAAVRRGENSPRAFPVAVAATEENAALLEKRVAFLRTEILPNFE